MEWINIATLCEKLHTLPSAGGLLDQEESVVKKLVIIYEHIDAWRAIEIKRASSAPPEGSR